MSHVTTRKGASTDEKDKPDNSPVRDMKKKVAANAEKEKMAADKQNCADKAAESKQNGDKHAEKASRSSDKQNGDKPKDKPVEKPLDKKEKAVEKPADKKEKSVEKPADKKEKAVEKPADKKEKAVEKPADKKETDKTKEDAAKGERSTKQDRRIRPHERPHNGVNGGGDVTPGPAAGGDSDEDMLIVIDDQENDELFPELKYDDTSDAEGFETQEGFRSATRRSQAKSNRTPETPRPASDKRPDVIPAASTATATPTAAAAATNTEGKETVQDAPKEGTKVLKLNEDPYSATERKLRSADSPRKQTEKPADSPNKPADGKKDEDTAEDGESQDGDARKPDTNFSKSRVKVSPYRRSMRLADQTTSSVNATYTGNNTTMEMDITESSFSEQPSVSGEAAAAELNGSHVSALRGIRGRRSYKPLKELTMRTVTRRPPTMPVTGAENPARPTGTVVGRKRKPEADDTPSPNEAVEATEATESLDAVHAKRMRLLDKLMSPFRRALPSSTPLPQRRAAPIVGINTDLPLSVPVVAEPFDAEALKNVPTAAQPTAQLAQGVLSNGSGDDASKKCIVM